MNTEDLYFGSIRKVTKLPETSTEQMDTFSTQQDYTFFKERNGKYKDICPIFGKHYKTTFENIGDSFIKPDQLIPYRELNIIQINRTKSNKSRRKLLKELEQIKKELLEEFDTSQFFVGYICQVIKAEYIPGTGKTIAKQLLTSGAKTISKPIKKTIFFKKEDHTYVDLDTGVEYSNYGWEVGDVYVHDSSKYLIPFNFYLSLEEKCTRMTKRKVLSRFKEITSQTSQEL